jgi:uncharacterized protein YjlB
MYECPSTQLSFGDPSMSKSQAMSGAAQTIGFERNEWVPNNTRLPVLIYPVSIAVKESDPVSPVETVLRANGWPPQWRYGIYS